MCEIGKNKVDNNFFEFLKEEEGFENKTYPDTEGNLTIGIGHKLLPGELYSGYIKIKGVPIYYKDGLSDEQVIDLCMQDTQYASDCVNKLVKVKLTQNQFNALVSFCYNIGNFHFLGSTLLKKLNNNQFEDVPTQMRRWNKEAKNGKLVESKGLINRRESEIKMWNS